jgi:hypothetical protein
MRPLTLAVTRASRETLTLLDNPRQLDHGLADEAPRIAVHGRPTSPSSEVRLNSTESGGTKACTVQLMANPKSIPTVESRTPPSVTGIEQVPAFNSGQSEVKTFAGCCERAQTASGTATGSGQGDGNEEANNKRQLEGDGATQPGSSNRR